MHINEENESVWDFRFRLICYDAMGAWKKNAATGVIGASVCRDITQGTENRLT